MKRGVQQSCSHLPSNPQRPEYPRGLRVLLIESDSKASAEAQQQLKDCTCCAIPCSSAAEAACLLANQGANAVDLILADLSCLLAAKTTGLDAVVAAGNALPLVLMTSGSIAAEGMAGSIQLLGAVDLLQKPLGMSKVRNLWRQSALRLKAIGSAKAADGGVKAIPGKEDSGCGTNSAGGQSNASTAEQMKPEHLEFDLETTSFDAFAVNGPHDLDCSPLGFGLSAVLQADAPLDLLGADELRALFDACPENGLVESCSFGDFVGEQPSKKGRPSFDNDFSAPWAQDFNQAQEFERAQSGGHSSVTNSGGGGAELTLTAPPPAIGYPAGQMPALPTNMPGMVWGLPTNPLQIVPKPIPAHLGIGQQPANAPSAAFPVPAHGPAMVAPWGQMGPMMMPPHMGGPPMLPPLPGMLPGGPPMPPPPTGMFGPHGMMMMGAGGPPMGLGPFMPPLPPAAPAPCSSAAPAAPPASAVCMKRSDSAQLLPLPLHSFPPMPGMPPMMPGLPPFPAACDMGPLCAGGVMLPPINAFRCDFGPPDLMMGPDGKGKGPQRPPLGLQLKKSPSFADLISEHLRQTASAS